jgi:hypothetical protein
VTLLQRLGNSRGRTTRSLTVTLCFSNSYVTILLRANGETSQNRFDLQLRLCHLQLNLSMLLRSPFHSQQKMPLRPWFFSISQLKMSHLRLKTASAPRNNPQIRSQTRQSQSSSPQSQLNTSRLQSLNVRRRSCPQVLDIHVLRPQIVLAPTLNASAAVLSRGRRTSSGPTQLAVITTTKE